MKQVTKNILMTALLSSLFLSSTAFAQQRMAIVSVEAVFQAMPQAAAIQQQISEEFKDQTNKVQALEADVEYHLNKRQRETATMSEQEIMELEEKILSMRNEYAEMAKPLQQNMQRRLAEERNRLLGLIQEAIQMEARESGYNIVLTADAVAFADGEIADISQRVLDRLSR